MTFDGWKIKEGISLEHDEFPIRFLQPYREPNSKEFFKSAEGANTMDPQKYVLRDLLWVDISDLVFGYLTDYGVHSRSVGLSGEICYAKGIGTKTILCSVNMEVGSFDFIKQVADVNLESLEDGAEYLATLAYHLE